MEIFIKKLIDTKYSSLYDSANAMYCEIKYQRDRSSFAGIAFEITNSKGVFIDEYKEELYLKVNKYENIYIGMEDDYCNSIKDIYDSTCTNIGLIVHFLVYSDVKSSQIIYEQLTEWILKNYKNFYDTQDKDTKSDNHSLIK